VKAAKQQARKEHQAALKKHKEDEDHAQFEDQFGHHVVDAIQGLARRVKAMREPYRTLLRERDPQLYRERMKERDEEIRKRAVMFKGTLPRRIKAFGLQEALGFALQKTRENRAKRASKEVPRQELPLVNEEVRYLRRSSFIVVGGHGRKSLLLQG